MEIKESKQTRHYCRRCRGIFYNSGPSLGSNKVLCMECGEYLSEKYEPDKLPKSYKGLLDDKWEWDN